VNELLLIIDSMHIDNEARTFAFPSRYHCDSESAPRNEYREVKKISIRKEG
jgi:hypothetical protein